MITRPPLDPDDPMPFGPHRGLPMQEVPIEHLAWLRAQSWIKDYPRIAAYLAVNKKRIDGAQPEQRPDSGGGFSSYDDYMQHGR